MKKRIAILAILAILSLIPKTYAQVTTQSIPVLMYHRIQLCPTNTTDCADITVQPQEFRDQMQYLKDNSYVTLTMDQVLYHKKYNLPLPANSVAITFDDGYATQFREAYPVLKANRQRATFYIISNMVGVAGSGVMTWSQIMELQRSGVGRIEGHTHTHPRLTNITLEQVRNELVTSKAMIESYTQMPVSHIAYPNGAYNDDIIVVAQENGYETGVITCRVNCIRGVNSQNYAFGDSFRIDRKTVFPKMLMTDFITMLTN